jgi:thiamine transport system substrate-binding protein
VNRRTTLRFVAAVMAVAVPLAACSGDDDDAATTTPAGATTTPAGSTAAPAGATAAPAGSITLVTYDSWTDALNDVLAQFTDATGIGVKVLRAGDTGQMVNKAVLTAGNPEGDVMFGVDNTFLSQVVDGNVLTPYTAAGLDAVPAALRELVPNGEATPIDFGDVCVNTDKTWFTEHELAPPTDLRSLTDPAYKGLLVVENPATSSPGLAFVLATIAEFGDDGWVDYWKTLRANSVEVVDSWEDAYYGEFSGAGDGDRPLVVSYGSSPPAEVVFADPPIEAATTGVIDTTCFRQVEYAGVLRGTDHAEQARALIDFLLSPTFQAELPLNLFVYPADADVALPEVFTANATVPADPATLDPETIATNREAWLETWTDTVLR